MLSRFLQMFVCFDSAIYNFYNFGLALIFVRMARVCAHTFTDILSLLKVAFFNL